MADALCRLWFLTSRLLENKGSDPASLAITVLRKSTDFVVLPSHDGTREFFEFCKEMLSYNIHQAIWTKDANVFITYDNAVEVLNKFVDTRSKNEGAVLTMISREPSAKLRHFAKEHSSQVILLSDDPEDARLCNSTLLYRHIAQPGEACLVESIAPDVKIVKGYVCCTAEDLVAAYDAIRSDAPTCTVVLRPVKRQGPENDLWLSSAQELLMYDFPFGDVVLEQALNYDVSADGLPIGHAVSYLHGKIFPVVDVLYFGNTKQGVQTSRASEETREHMTRWTTKILTDPRVASSGAGTFEFSSVNGQPILRKIAMGLSSEHILHFFLDMYAPNRHFLLWRSVAHPSLDIWAIWFRLYDRGVAFQPGKKRSTFGIFPLLHVREGISFFIAIGDSAVDVAAHRASAEEALREPLVEQPLHHVTFSSDVRRIWCGSARPEYRRETQRYNLPNRCLPLVRPQKDLIILPGGHKPTREWWRFCKEILGLSEDQALFTSGSKFVMDDDMTDDVVSRIKAVVGKSPRGTFTLVPYCVTSNFERWANQLRDLGVTLFGETFEWVQAYGHKGILHRHIKTLDEPCFIEKVAPNVRVAKGYTCSTSDDLVKAFELLGTQDVVIKPIFGAAGEGIKFVKGPEPLKVYDFPMGDVVLEEFLNLDKTEDGIVLSPAVHYMGNAFVGEGLVDQIMVGTGYMGWRRSRSSIAFQKTVFKSTEKIIKAMDPNGPGGFDFLSVDGLAFLSDINTGRFNGAHFPKLFRDLYAPGCEFYCWKFKPPVSLTVEAFWGRLQSQGLAFEPGKSTTGVFPLTYLRGLSGLYIALAPTDAEAEALYLRAKQCLTERVPLVPLPRTSASSAHPTPPQQSSFKLTLLKNLDVIYAPQELELHNILLAGPQIAGLLTDEDVARMEAVVGASGGMVIDCKGSIAVPGLVDINEHVSGGGGELGPGSRTPEAKVSDLISAGVTTVVGVAGVDTLSRNLENLLMKCRSLEAEGITAFMWTGSGPATSTVCGSIIRDMCLIDKVVGVGEIETSGYFSARPTVHQLEAMASECNTASMLSGKAGIVSCHLVRGERPLDILREVLKESGLPVRSFLPTQIEGTGVEDGIQWIAEGGFIDFAGMSDAVIKALVTYFARGVNMDHVIVSSHAYGALPLTDMDPKLVAYRTRDPHSLLGLFRKLFFNFQWPPERILPLITRNPASLLKLKKGTLQVGADADVLILDTSSLSLKHVFARGQHVKSPTHTQRGMFE